MARYLFQSLELDGNRHKRCPHTSILKASGDIDEANSWCESHEHPGWYFADSTGGTHDNPGRSRWTFCFSDADVAFEFKMRFA